MVIMYHSLNLITSMTEILLHIITSSTCVKMSNLYGGETNKCNYKSGKIHEKKEDYNIGNSYVSTMQESSSITTMCHII